MKCEQNLPRLSICRLCYLKQYLHKQETIELLDLEDDECDVETALEEIKIHNEVS